MRDHVWRDLPRKVKQTKLETHTKGDMIYTDGEKHNTVEINDPFLARVTLQNGEVSVEMSSIVNCRRERLPAGSMLA